MNRIAWLGLAFGAAMLAGCPRIQQPTTSKTAPVTTRASVTLRVLVVNDPPLAEAISRLRGEWTERSGGELTALPITWQDAIDDKSLAGDIIVFPSRYLGELCTRNLLRPLRSS